jgi:hypothetical protein
LIIAISPDQWSEEVTSQKDAVSLPKTQALTARQRVAVHLAGWTLGVLLLVNVIMMLVALFSTPHLDTSLSDSASAVLLSCLKERCNPDQVNLAKQLVDQATNAAPWQGWWLKVYERLGATLVPLVTALLGFIFGTQHERHD